LLRVVVWFVPCLVVMARTCNVVVKIFGIIIFPMTEPVGMQFPTRFRLRVVGITAEDFAGFILESLLPYIPGLSLEDLEIHPSAAGKYTALHVSFTAESREQLDGIYTCLSASERVLWVM